MESILGLANCPTRVGLEAEEVFRAVQPPEALLVGEAVAVKGGALGEKAGEDVAAKITGHIAGYCLQHRRFKKVNAGVHPVGEDLVGKRFLQKPRNPIIGVQPNYAALANIFPVVQGHGGQPALGSVRLAKARDIAPAQIIAIPDQERSVEMPGGSFHCPCGAKGMLLERVMDVDAQAPAIAKVTGDDIGQVTGIEHELLDPKAATPFDGVEEHGLSRDWDHALGDGIRERTQAGARAGNQDHCLHAGRC